MSLEERIENLDLIGETLRHDHRFYLNRKDWPKVKVFAEKLRLHKEQMLKVQHLLQMKSKGVA